MRTPDQRLFELLVQELRRPFEQGDRHLPRQITVHADAMQAALGFEHLLIQLAIELQPLVRIDFLQEAKGRLLDVILAVGKHDPPVLAEDHERAEEDERQGRGRRSQQSAGHGRCYRRPEHRSGEPAQLRREGRHSGSSRLGTGPLEEGGRV